MRARTGGKTRHRGAGALVLLALVASTRTGRTHAARDALAEAKVAITAQPPNREAARAALMRATAAQDDSAAVADAFLGLARMDRDERAYAHALANYRACVAAAPNTLWAQRATQQIAWLTARAEGDFAPLDRFERVELDPAQMSDPAAIDALARDADAFPPGRVRLEARRFVAEAWLALPERHADALRELQSLRSDLPFADLFTDRAIERELVDALIANGNIEEAAHEVTHHSDHFDPALASQVQRLARRRAFERAARLELFLFSASILGALIVQKLRSLRAPKGAPLHALRAGFALGIAISALSATFLLLETTSPKALERLGL
jgi:hypothetical protein